jgi:hypothetical protein
MVGKLPGIEATSAEELTDTPCVRHFVMQCRLLSDVVTSGLATNRWELANERIGFCRPSTSTPAVDRLRQKVGFENRNLRDLQPVRTVISKRTLLDAMTNLTSSAFSSRYRIILTGRPPLCSSLNWLWEAYGISCVYPRPPT